MFFSLVLCTLVASMVGLLQTEYRQVHRSNHFAQTLHLAEAGAEEGIAMLNNGGSSWTTNGWTASGTNYTKTVTNLTAISSSSSIGTYQVTVLGPSSANPQIVSTGTVANSFLGASISRAVKVTLAGGATFRWAIHSETTIETKKDALIDSFDSTSASYSDFTPGGGCVTGGAYGLYDSSLRKDNGDVAANGTSSGTINVAKDCTFYGDVSTGPGGTIANGGNLFIGYLTNSVPSVNSNRISSTSTEVMPLPTVPFSSSTSLGAITGSPTINGGSGTPVDYNATSINSSGVITFANGYTRLHVTGNINWDEVIVNPGSRVEVYLAGSMDASKNAEINVCGQAYQLVMYGLSASSSFSSDKGWTFTGCIYAPGCDFDFKKEAYWSGALVGKSFSFKKSLEFHYDESLLNNGPVSGCTVVSWQEL